MNLAVDLWIKKNKSKIKDENELSHLLDFFEKKYSHKKSINFSYEQAIEKSKKWIVNLNINQIKNTGLTEIVLKLDNGFNFVKLIDQESKNWEGFYMKHCVSSYLDHKNLYSLRDINNIPHCTIEIKNGEIEQIKGRANSFVSPKYINYVIEFLKFKNLKIKEFELKNIGYYSLQKETSEILINNFSNFFNKEFNGKEYFYSQSRIKLDKDFKEQSGELFHFLSISGFCFDGLSILIRNGVPYHKKEVGFCSAAKRNDFPLLNLILESKFSPLNAIIDYCFKESNISFIKELLSKELSNYSSLEFLKLAISHNRLDVVELLVMNQNVKITTTDLMFSLKKKCSFNLIRFLVENSSNIDFSFSNFRILFYSLDLNIEIFSFLFEKSNVSINTIKELFFVSNLNNFKETSSFLKNKIYP